MKQIRNSTFETNSSSTHVLAISTDKKVSLKIPKIVRFKKQDFGWEYRIYNSTTAKFSYLFEILTYCAQSSDKKWLYENIDKLVSTIKSFGVKDVIVPKIEWTKSEYSGSKYEYISDKITGYIDHGHCALGFLGIVMSDPEKLKRFLFDRRSYISTGNDNEFGYYIPDVGNTDGYNIEHAKDLRDELDEEELEAIEKFKDKKLDKKFEFYWKGN